MGQSKGLKHKRVFEQYQQLNLTDSPSEKVAIIDRLLNEFPNDAYIALLRVRYLHDCQRYSEAHAAIRYAQQLPTTALGRFLMTVVEVECLVSLGETKEAEKICEALILSAAPLDQKTQMIESFVWMHLHRERLEDLLGLENWAKRGLELDPTHAELRIALDSVLVERGDNVEAEKILPEQMNEVPSTAEQFRCAIRVLMRSRIPAKDLHPITSQ